MRVMTGPIEAQIRRKLAQLNPSVLEIYNDSAKHAHHAGMRGSTNTAESHFRLSIVSDRFDGLSKPMRHRLIYNLLADEMKMANGVHAVQMTTRTPAEAAQAENALR